MKLNLGSGDRYLNGYINVDLFDKKADLIHDLTRSLPFGNNSIDEILAFHIIEHFSEKEWQEIIKDWYRVLVPDGIIEIKCPEIRVCAANLAFDTGGQTWAWWIKTIYGNQEHKGQFHKNGFTFDKLKADLENAGFIAIRELPGESTTELRVRAMK